MTNPNYIRGRRFEYRVKEALEKDGWIVFRCAGSKPVDLIAFKMGPKSLFHVVDMDKNTPSVVVSIGNLIEVDTGVILVECKARGARVPKDQKYALMELAAKCGAALMVATSKKRKIIFTRLQ